MNAEKIINFPIVFHFHQPVDNFPWVYDDCFEKAYGPLIDSIYKEPELKATLHFSGNLLDWFIENKPDFITKIKEMAERGQIEIIGGGYYEPIYAIIPHRDKIAQMKKLSDLIHEEFGLEVNGAWLSERVWEPNYPSFLNEAGLKYVIVDDNHFRSTGITEEETLYSYITEDDGKTLRVFPINEEIRYLTPWKPSTKTIKYLENIADEEGNRIALMISDAEKMGVWGSTHQICYVDGKGHEEGDEGKPFIPTLFKRIVENKWIHSMTLTEYMNAFPARDLVYIPTASYDKMEEWVLSTPVRKKFKKLRKAWKDDKEKEDEYLFLKGGFWRHFLVKYPESNNMHKKMLHVREKLIKLEESLGNNLDGKIIRMVEECWEEIYKAQCNDCYWHGMFGGIYLQFLRFGIYTHLITAEKLIDEIQTNTKLSEKSQKAVILKDFNKDSHQDALIESEKLNVYIDASRGGTIFELDYKPKSYNLLNTLTRWKEAYHDDEMIQDGTVKVDRYRRSMFRLRIFHDDADLRKIQSDSYFEFSDLIEKGHEIVDPTKNEATAEVRLTTMGTIKHYHSEEKMGCSIEKIIRVEGSTIELILKGRLNQESEEGEEFHSTLQHLNLGIDLPFFFNGNTKEFRWQSEGLKFTEKEEQNNLLEPYIYNGNDFCAYDGTYDLKLTMKFDGAAEPKMVIKFPIIAYAYTDTGYQDIFQGINMMPVFKLENEFEIKLSLDIT